MTTESLNTQFEQTWAKASGSRAWMREVNSQVIGKRFIVTAFMFFALGGFMALLLRLQLAVSDNTFLSPEMYNRFFTMHGSSMMYLFAVPVLEGIAIYLLPSVIGSRESAYPRLSAYSYWLYLFGGLIFYASFFADAVPDAGWFAYTPLSGAKYSGWGVDFWLLGLSLVEISGIAAAINLVVTILKLRSPGMSLHRMPLLAWTFLVSGFMMIFAFTVLLMATLLLEMDRSLGTHFFNPEGGGHSLLWQHLFWFFGHPEVYIMFIPATGIISMIIPTFARRALAGYSLVTVAIVVMGFVSFGLWVHHMFTTGLPELAAAFFTAASLMIALASGTQVFSWIATLWGRRPQFTVPMLYAFGFLSIFVLGGLTGVMVAVVPFDRQVHDTFFVVAHFHYVLIGGVVFPIFGALYYWLPKVTGKVFESAMARGSFWCTYIGFHLAFFPMHVMGLLGMPRRVYTYPSELKLDIYNMVSTTGSLLMGVGFLLMIYDFWRGRKIASVHEDPWKAGSLEWSTSSPPANYTYKTAPVVTSRYPLWDNGLTESSLSHALFASPPNFRATWVTDMMFAKPQALHFLSGPTIVPFFAALGTVLVFLAILFKVYLLIGFGLIVTLGALGRWLLPSTKTFQMLHSSEVPEKTNLTLFPTGKESILWWGALGFTVVLALILGVLVFCYFYLRLYSPVWPQGDLPKPDGASALLVFLTLATSYGSFQLGKYFSNKSDEARTGSYACFGLSMSSLIVSVGLLIHELREVSFSMATNAYGSLYFTFLFFLIFLLLLMGGITGVLMVTFHRWKKETQALKLEFQIVSLLWHLALASAVVILSTLFISPYIV